MQRNFHNKHLYSKYIFSLFLISRLLMIPVAEAAGWSVVTQTDEEMNVNTHFAYSMNAAGYSLGIYRDSVDAIRLRFNLPDGLVQLATKSCPTYQIDKGIPQNRSIYDAPCISNKKWAEFILGHTQDKQVSSSELLAIMDGIGITLRFILGSGDYRETRFSLDGSRSAIASAIGEDLKVLTTQ